MTHLGIIPLTAKRLTPAPTEQAVNARTKTYDAVQKIRNAASALELAISAQTGSDPLMIRSMQIQLGQLNRMGNELYRQMHNLDRRA